MFQGQEAVFDVLKQHERNPSKAFDSILKVIRSQIDEKKSEKEQNMTGSQSISYDGGKSGSKIRVGGAGSSTTGGGKADDGKSSLATTGKYLLHVQQHFNKVHRGTAFYLLPLFLVCLF